MGFNITLNNAVGYLNKHTHRYILRNYSQEQVSILGDFGVGN